MSLYSAESSVLGISFHFGHHSFNEFRLSLNHGGMRESRDRTTQRVINNSVFARASHASDVIKSIGFQPRGTTTGELVTHLICTLVKRRKPVKKIQPLSSVDCPLLESYTHLIRSLVSDKQLSVFVMARDFIVPNGAIQFVVVDNVRSSDDSHTVLLILLWINSTLPSILNVGASL